MGNKSQVAEELQKFYKGKKVLITGHTGFKGTWLCAFLLRLGAEVVGYALEPPTQPALFDMAFGKADALKAEDALKLTDESFKSIIGDVRDAKCLQNAFDEAQPEIVFHLAAQPIVRTSYEEPVYTYETNVMGTVNVLECARQTASVRSVVNVTTDKVYRNDEVDRGYVEEDVLNGYDPYSNSKSCSELVTDSYKKSFFDLPGCEKAVSTARAGNVIGGGDFARDRIIPDCVRAALVKNEIIVRNPHSVRPFQHVIEPLAAYLLIAMRQWQDKEQYAGCYNIGPEEEDCVNTGRLVDIFCEKWGEGLTWKNTFVGGPHEAGFLKLDCSKAKRVLSWRPMWHIDKAVEMIVDWYRAVDGEGADVRQTLNRQIDQFLQEI